MKDILDWCNSTSVENHILDIPEYFYEELTPLLCNVIIEHFQNDTLFKLPQKEILFFEWLKNNDKPVWDDIWLDDLFEPYLVSLALLPRFCYNNYSAYPICELRNNDNFYFVPQHLADKESDLFVESSKTRYMEKEALTIPQWLALTISMGAVDIWHFAYKNELDLKDCKDAVLSLVDDKILVHLKDPDHLSVFVEL